jgi:hypothetical protein
MPTEAYVYDESFKAENDLSSNQYYAVELSDENQVDVCDGAGDIPIGILQNKPEEGEPAQVRILGRTRAVSDGSGDNIAVGNWVGTDANGKMVKKSTNKDFALGIALSASTADGTIIDVLICPVVLNI